MATRNNKSSKFPVRDSPLGYSILVVIWTVWAVLTVHEYVSESFGLPAFLLALVGGLFLGGVFFAWVTRTDGGRKAKRLYDDAPLGQQFAVGLVLLVPFVALMYGVAAIGVSLVLLEVVWFSGLFGYFHSAFVSGRSRSA